MQNSIKKWLFLSSFILLIVFAGAQEIIVSVSDFSVESKNEKFTYMGKVSLPWLQESFEGAEQ